MCPSVPIRTCPSIPNNFVHTEKIPRYQKYKSNTLSDRGNRGVHRFNHKQHFFHFFSVKRLKGLKCTGKCQGRNPIKQKTNKLVLVIPKALFHMWEAFQETTNTNPQPTWTTKVWGVHQFTPKKITFVGKEGNHLLE